MTAEQLTSALRDVNDPEYPISIVDMGLVRGVELHRRTARVRLTYTSMGCPCTELITADVRARLLSLEGVDEVEIIETFDEWKREHISARGLNTLRGLGVG
ncbi:MAG: metal-sulfur cluster assembly factor [Solirubrobacteraceae bacterium]|jgi:metal-sulfur cluster biosynthetic enzyme